MDRAQHQIFDGSFLEALLAAQQHLRPGTAPDAGIAPPAQPDQAETVVPELPSEPAQWDDFDWDGYSERVYSELPPDWKKDQESRDYAKAASLRLFLARQLATNVTSYLLRNSPPKAIWTFLQAEKHLELLHTATRGFQRNASTMRQPVVRARIIKWLETNPSETFLLLAVWADQSPAPAVLGAVQTHFKGDTLPHQWAALVKKYGPEAIVAALAWQPAPLQFNGLIHQMEDAEAFAELLSGVEEDFANPEAAGDVTATVTYQTDAERATYWQTEAEELRVQVSQNQDAMNLLLTRGEELKTQAEKNAADLQVAVRREKQSIALWEKKLTHLEAKAKSEHDKLLHDFERTSRKLKAIEREKADFETETRRLKKQLRHTQQLLEDERKRVPQEECPDGEPTAKTGASKLGGALEAVSTPDATPATNSRPIVVAPPTPLDELFEWKSDGRPVRLTARAVKRLVDANDEDAVFTIMQALDSLHDRDKEMRGKFLQRLAQAGAYYPRVLTVSTTRVLVDASNVARYQPNRYGKGQLRFLLSMREELRRLDCFPVVFYADASLPHFIDDPRELRAMIMRGEILMADKGTEADELLAREARRSGAYVVTNDRLFFNKVSPDFEPPRITFRIYDGTVIVDEF